MSEEAIKQLAEAFCEERKVVIVNGWLINLMAEFASQARQQVVADLKRELCELAELGAKGNSKPAAFALRRFADVIREFNPSSLTPPPALTKEK